MQPARRARWIRWLTGGVSVRRPRHPPASAGSERVTESQLLADAQTLRQIIDGLEALEARVRDTEIVRTAEPRGYLTPAEDDRVRRALLAYRNYRLALYDILLRLEHYPRLRPANRRLKAFLIAWVTALTLYGRSLRLNALAAQSPLVRAKLNEPEPRFELPQGFFDDVMAGYCSLRNYGSIIRALSFWCLRRRAIRQLGRSEPVPWAELERCAARERHRVQSALDQVLRSRMRRGWRVFWQTAFRPVNRVRYGVRSTLGGRFAGYWLHPEHHQAPDDALLSLWQQRLARGDVLLMRSEGKLTASLLPGFWAHAAIYLGQCVQPPARGTARETDHTGAAAPADDTASPAALGYVIEGVSPCVRLATLKTCLDADHVLVLRPELPEAVREEALEEAMQHLGKPYDFEFDFNLSSRLVCTGLVFRTYHDRGGIEFRLIKRLGNFTLTGDDLVEQTMEMSRTPRPPIRPVALMLRRRDGWRLYEEPGRILTLLRRIQRGWRPLRIRDDSGRVPPDGGLRQGGLSEGAAARPRSTPDPAGNGS